MKMCSRGTLVLMFALLSFVCCPTSCAWETPDPPMFTVQQYPKVDGSISTQPLAILIACRLTHTSFESCKISPDMTNSIYPTTDPYKSDKRFFLDPKSKILGAPFVPPQPQNIKTDLWEKIEHTNTHPSYIRLIERKVELTIAAREPSDDEIVRARQNGVQIRTAPIARDALVFIVHESNPVASLSIGQIRAIYSGQLTNWAELGGGTSKINPYRRNRNSGSEEKMQQLVMKRLPTVATHSLTPDNRAGSVLAWFDTVPTVVPSMFGPFNALIHDRQGIGYTPYYYERYMARTPAVKVMAINNVMPSQETISNGAYPLITEVVVAYLSDLPKESPAAGIRDWLLTADGQKVVAESGYVPVKQ